MAYERTSVQVVGGGAGTYPIPNPYGNSLAELFIHSWAGSGATSSAVLDIDGALNAAPAALPTFKAPLRGLVFTSIGDTNSYGPLVTQAEGSVVLYNIAGSSWLVYQWGRIVPDPGADSIRHTLEVTVGLMDAARKACEKGPSCGCKTHRAISRYLGDSGLAGNI